MWRCYCSDRAQERVIYHPIGRIVIQTLHLQYNIPRKSSASFSISKSTEHDDDEEKNKMEDSQGDLSMP